MDGMAWSCRDGCYLAQAGGTSIWWLAGWPAGRPRMHVAASTLLGK
jgi:hypothetical protein